MGLQMCYPNFFIAEMEKRQRNDTSYSIYGITTVRKGKVIQRHYLFTIVHKRRTIFILEEKWSWSNYSVAPSLVIVTEYQYSKEVMR